MAPYASTPLCLAATPAPLPRKSAVGAASASSVLQRLQIRNTLFLLLRYSYCQRTAVHRPCRRERPGAKAGSSSVGGVGGVKCFWANGTPDSPIDSLWERDKLPHRLSICSKWACKDKAASATSRHSSGTRDHGYRPPVQIRASLAAGGWRVGESLSRSRLAAKASPLRL